MTRTRKTNGPSLPERRMRQNPHDHVARFLHDEFVIGGSRHVQISAMLEAYRWWTSANGVRNRLMSPVALIDHLREVYSVQPQTCHYTRDGEYGTVYALYGIRFRHDNDGFNWRLRYRGADSVTRLLKEDSK